MLPVRTWRRGVRRCAPVVRVTSFRCCRHHHHAPKEVVYSGICRWYARCPAGAVDIIASRRYGSCGAGTGSANPPMRRPSCLCRWMNVFVDYGAVNHERAQAIFEMLEGERGGGGGVLCWKWGVGAAKRVAPERAARRESQTVYGQSLTGLCLQEGQSQHPPTHERGVVQKNPKWRGKGETLGGTQNHSAIVRSTKCLTTGCGVCSDCAIASQLS